MTRSIRALLAPGACVALTCGSLSAQVPVQQLLPVPAPPYALFGLATATDGEWLAVAAQGEGVHLFRREAGAFALVETLHPDDGLPGQEFGACVAVDAGRLAVGAPGDAEHGVDAGAVYLFELVDGAWQQREKLFAADATAQDRFGSSVDLSAGRVIVGAPGRASSGESTGAAFVLEFVGFGWLQLAQLQALEPAEFDRFGGAVAIDGDLALVGADGDSTVAPAAGAAYVWRRTPTGWSFLGKLAPGDLGPIDAFGAALDVSGATLAVGARLHGAGGAVYLFEVGADDQLGLQQKVVPADADPLGRFGAAVQLEGDRLLASAIGADAGASDAGAVYVFERAAGAWTEEVKLVSPAPQKQEFFGESIAVSGGMVACGAPLSDAAGAAAGAVHLFALDRAFASFCECGGGAPCANPDAGAGCANSTGAGAALFALGSASAAADDLVLQATGLPPAAPGVLCMAAARDAVVFGDGLLCLSASAGLSRFAPTAADGGGALTLGPGIVAASRAAFGVEGAIAPGATWHFQCWYRDPGGPCGQGSNLSAGLSVAFVP